jgi:uroporphyrin-III C-methyltransferase/precorrin-2 dehydrogenase/sirohydrochlorin ferrochelatase
MNELFFSTGGETEEDCGPLMQALACLPVFFALAGKRVVLVGGSNAILWKAELCQAAGAELEVFSANPCPGLVALASRRPSVSLIARQIAPADFSGAALAIAEAESTPEAAGLQAAARAAGVAVNIDKPRFGFSIRRDCRPFASSSASPPGRRALAQTLRGRSSHASARNQIGHKKPSLAPKADGA